MTTTHDINLRGLLSSALLLSALSACTPQTTPLTQTPTAPTRQTPTETGGLVEKSCTEQCIEARQMEAIGADVIAFQCQQGCERCVERCLTTLRPGTTPDGAAKHNPDALTQCERSCAREPSRTTP